MSLFVTVSLVPTGTVIDAGENAKSLIASDAVVAGGGKLLDEVGGGVDLIDEVGGGVDLLDELGGGVDVLDELDLGVGFGVGFGVGDGEGEGDGFAEGDGVGLGSGELLADVVAGNSLGGVPAVDVCEDAASVAAADVAESVTTAAADAVAEVLVDALSDFLLPEVHAVTAMSISAGAAHSRAIRRMVMLPICRGLSQRDYGDRSPVDCRDPDRPRQTDL
ncbi:MAG: hypothetical protein ABI912_06175 [Actinomycetota bacterium]